MGINTIDIKHQQPFTLHQVSVTPQDYSIVTADNHRQVLQPKWIEVLAFLAGHYPQLVSREALIDAVWNGNYFVGEKALTNAIWSLRKVLNQGDEQYIETVRKSGYRLLHPPCYNDEQKNEQSNEQNSQSVTDTPPKKFSLLTRYGPGFLLLVLMAFAVLHFARDHTDQPILSPPTITSITMAPGREIFPALSPDGRYVAYSWRRMQQKIHLFSKDLSQPDLPPRQLSFGDNQSGRMVWAADGKSLYYIRRSNNNTRCEVVQLILATGQQQSLARCIDGNSNVYLGLSPDNHTLAFTSRDDNSDDYNNNNNSNSNNDTSNTSGIYFLALDVPDAKPQRFSCAQDCNYLDREFAFSPDGRQLAVSRRVEDLIEDIFLVDINDKTSKRLTRGEGDIKGLAWHPDGQRIVYGAENSGARDGHMISLKDGSITPLQVPSFSYPEFFPDGHALLYYSFHVRTHIAYLSLADKLTATPFPLLQSEYNYGGAHYSAVTKRLVFVSNQSGDNEIWTSNLEGEDRQRLTRLHNNLLSPRWSADGRQIAFLGPDKQALSNRLYVLTLATRQVKALQTPFEQHYAPSWSIDGRSVIAAVDAGERSGFYAFTIADTGENTGAGSQPKMLLPGSGRFAEITAEQKIWFTKGRNQGLWLFDLTQPTQPAKQVLNGKRFGTRYNWTIVDQQIYFQSNHASHLQINRYNMASQQLKVLSKLPLRTLASYGSMTYIPQQERLLFTESEFPQVDIKKLRHPLLMGY